MRLATLLTVIVALTLGVASAAETATWTAPATIRSCGPAAEPKVIFPYSIPQTRSGKGAIVWLGRAPACAGAAGTTLDGASLHSNDTLSLPRPLVRGSGALGPLEVAMTTKGQIVTAFGRGGDGAVLGEGVAGTTFSTPSPLGGPAGLVATANGYIGDADVVTTADDGGTRVIELRAQRHYESSFQPPVSFGVGPAPITALTVGMDFRADSIILWAQRGEVYARWINNVGHVFPTRVLGPAGYAPQLAAVLSDNNHAFVMWTDEPRPGVVGPTTIYLEHSGNNVTFGAPRALVTFTEPTAQRLTPGAVMLARMSPSEGVLAAWTSMIAGSYVVEAAGLTSRGALPPATIAEQGQDVRLATVATGPHDDAVAVVEEAPRAAGGFDGTHQAILAARTVPGGPGGTSFETPAQLAAPGENSAPSVAIDPATDRAV
ncbi:MAG: hypothetical protein ACRDLP_09880, partial [Solirubrobacteraceae bacterium]